MEYLFYFVIYFFTFRYPLDWQPASHLVTVLFGSDVCELHLPQGYPISGCIEMKTLRANQVKKEDIKVWMTSVWCTSCVNEDLMVALHCRPPALYNMTAIYSYKRKFRSVHLRMHCLDLSDIIIMSIIIFRTDNYNVYLIAISCSA